MSSNYDIKTDLDEAEAMAEHLSEYVRGDELYGRAGGGMFSQHPSLTVGALLMRLRRLNELRGKMKDHQSKRLDNAIDNYQTVRNDWAHHYEEKMRQEAHSRVDAMRTFFQECDEEPRRCADIYRPEQLRRTIVQEIIREMQAMNITDDDLMRKVNATDSKLRQYFADDEFEWDSDLKSTYPENEFWWLYQAPQKSE